jgi:hypothetical protein
VDRLATSFDILPCAGYVLQPVIVLNALSKPNIISTVSIFLVMIHLVV